MLRTILRYCVISSLTALVLPVAVHADISLVDAGQPTATIILSNAPSDQAKYAAEVLQTYVKKITGAELPIAKESEPVEGNRILVGRSAAVQALNVAVPSGHTSRMNEEAIIVKTVGDTLVLVGNEDWNYRGTLFAVYDFLETDLGCRWYFPGEYGEVLPHMDTLKVGALDRIERPSFRIRNLWYSGWMPADETARAEFQDWFERNKLNSLKVSLPGDGSIMRLVPDTSYYETHPEIFALDKDGNRQKDMLCMSEPETIRIAVETIKKTFRENPERADLRLRPARWIPHVLLRTVPAFLSRVRRQRLRRSEPERPVVFLRQQDRRRGLQRIPRSLGSHQRLRKPRPAARGLR